MLRQSLIVFLLTCFACNAVGQTNDDISDLDRLTQMIEMAWELSEEQPEDAIAVLLDAQKLAMSMNDTGGQAAILVELGSSHYYLSDNVSAVKYWREALKLSKHIDNRELTASLYNNIGNSFDTEHLDSCILYYRRSIQEYTAIGMDSALADILGNMAWTFYDQEKTDSAYLYAFNALNSFRSISDTSGICSMWSALGSIYTQRNDPDSALYWSHKALELSRKIGSMRLKEPTLKALRNAYFKKGQSELALQYADSLLQFMLDMNEIERLAMVHTMESRHEMQLKEMEIKGLEAESKIQGQEIRRQNIVIISSIIGFGLLIFLGVQMMKEKKRSENLLLNILPAQVADELKATGKAKARKYESVTVLFTDFKDFSKLSDEIAPEELVEMIDEHYSAFDKIIETYGLEKIKTIGDSYMAAGGLPEPSAGHAVKVVQAALEMQTHMNILQKRKKKEGKRFFETRIGVHTGAVVAGVVGIKKFAYDIWGDTVNTANRLEKAGEPGKVNISATTYERVKHSFDCSHRGKIPIKNMGEIDMYFVG